MVVDKVIRENIDENTDIDSEDSTSYMNLKAIVKEHNPKVVPQKEVGKIRPWVHIAIGNTKCILLDIYYDIKPEYLQNYLNEFGYKFNKKYFGENLFDRLLIAYVSYKSQFRCNTDNHLI